MERLLMYICVAGLVLTIATMATMWLYAHSVRPLFTRMARLGHTSPMSLLVAIAITAVGLEVAATKAPTNEPPPRLSAPHRSSSSPHQAFTPDEIEAGYVLWRVGTNETWNFNAPTNATIAAEWRCRGAAEDRIVLTNGAAAVAVDTRGRAMVGTNRYQTVDFRMAIVPEANWPLLGNGGSPSCVWLDGSRPECPIVSWQNALMDRDASAPVSVQIEILDGGDYICRYDLSRTESAESNVTSRLYYRIRPEDLDDPDRDDDGIPTFEEVTAYHSDPGLADTDGDGINDGLDANPLDPDADGDGIPDGMTAAEYWSHPLWTGTNPWDVSCVTIRLNEPVVPPARAVLVIGELPIILTTNAVYRLSLDKGVRYDVRLVTNHLAPVNLSLERGEQ